MQTEAKVMIESAGCLVQGSKGNFLLHPRLEEYDPSKCHNCSLGNICYALLIK